LWTPADRLAVTLLTVQWQLAKSEDPHRRDGTKCRANLLLTPLVFVARSRARRSSS